MLYRRVRLEALREAPYAFGSTYELESAFDEAAWRARVSDRARFLAEVDGLTAGTVSIGDADFPQTASITAMWVDPRFRRQGVGAALIKRALAWSRRRGYKRVVLWVADVNVDAEKLYARLGFAPTGNIAEVRPGDPALEHEMARRL